MPSTLLLDTCGRRRSPATLSSFHQGRPPRNKGQRYPADPPTVEEIIAVMRAAGDDNDGPRLRGLIVVLWRAGPWISEALALSESDLDPIRGAILIRHGKGGKRRESGWTGGHGSGLGRCCSFALRFRLARSSACCADHPEVTLGRPPAFALNYMQRLLERVSVVASRHISSGTLTRSRCRAKECRYL